MTSEIEHIREAAKYVEASGVTVTRDFTYPTVAIDAPGFDGVFMQGDEANAFIAECDALCEHFHSLDWSTAKLALAKPYVDNLCT